MPYTHARALPNRIGKVVVALVTGFGLAMSNGCMVGPNFQRPEVAVPAEWAGPAEPPTPSAASHQGEDLIRWWALFDDPVLTSLVERAIQSNLDLMRASARIRQARAARAVVVSGIGPTVDTSTSFRRNRSPVIRSERSGSVSRTEGVISNQYQGGFDAGWELDILAAFGETSKPPMQTWQ